MKILKQFDKFQNPTIILKVGGRYLQNIEVWMFYTLDIICIYNAVACEGIAKLLLYFHFKEHSFLKYLMTAH